MSYILDALKKSDQERKQGDVPDLQTMHVPVTIEVGPVRWPYFIIIILMLSLAFVQGMLRPWEEDAQVDMRDDKSTASQLVVNSQPLPAEDKKPQLVAATSSAPLAVRATAEKSVSKPVVAAAVVAETPALNVDAVQHLYDMPPLVQQAIPEMVFAGHVFSSSAEQRSVIINGHFMSEGEVIIGKLRIEKITAKGIVFDYNGQLFRMDILQDWSFD
jgi:general secretion pathway protein B